MMRKRINNNTSFPCPFLLPGHKSTKDFSTFFLSVLLGNRGWELQFIAHGVFLLHSPQGEHYSYPSHALVSGLSPGRQSSINFSHTLRCSPRGAIPVSYGLHLGQLWIYPVIIWHWLHWT